MVSITFSCEHVIKSFIMDVIINSFSEGSTKSSNLFHEEVNNPIKISKFRISSVSFLFVESFFGSKIIFSILDSFVRFSGELPSFFFNNKLNFEINSEFFKISFSSISIIVEGDNFGSRFNLINSSVESGLDFVFFEELSTGFKFVLESGKHSSNSLVDITNKIRSINSRFERCGIEFTFFVIGVIS